MRGTVKRALISTIVFVVIYLISDFVIGMVNYYDMYVKAIEFLAAVVGSGCYWIGSNER